MPLSYINDKEYGNSVMLENYLYISHLEEDYKYWFLPSSPDVITDNMGSTFTPTNALGRTAPVFTFGYAGPRTVQVSLKLHRDFMDDINITRSNSVLGEGEDYVDNLIRAIQAISLPKYNLSNKAVEPPLVAVRFGEQVFIKGVVTSGIGVSYEKPILYTNKYAVVSVGFTVSEVDPYDAQSVFKNGSFRGMVNSLKYGMNYMDNTSGSGMWSINRNI